MGAVQLRQALVTNAEYLAFMADGGYTRHELWHAEGWDWLAAQTQRAPLHWQPDPSHPDHEVCVELERLLHLHRNRQRVGLFTVRRR